MGLPGPPRSMPGGGIGLVVMVLVILAFVVAGGLEGVGVWNSSDTGQFNLTANPSGGGGYQPESVFTMFASFGVVILLIYGWERKR